MKISFRQIYAEPGTRFALSSMVLKLLRQRLEELDKELKFFSKKFGSDEFTLVCIITATRKNDVVEVMGPTYLRKTSEVEFAVYVPFKETASFSEKIAHVFGFLAQGIISIFEKYEADSSGIEDAFREVIEIVQRNPDDYQYPGDTR